VADATFDTHVDDYDAQCMQGLGLFGETREYVARERLAFLARWWRRRQRRPPRRILDYGCGVGDVTAWLAECFPEAEVLGLDPSPRCIERARLEHGAPRVAFARLADADAARADLVHVNGVVHHVARPARPALYAALAARLAPHGALALFENNPFNPGTRLAMRRIPFDRDAVPISARALRRGLRGAGLRVACTGYLFYAPAWLRPLRRLERWLEGVPLGAQYGVIATRAAEPP